MARKRTVADEVSAYEQTDEYQYTLIAKMSVGELLDYVICHPYYLTDSYYRGFDTAILKRHKELTT